MRPIDVPLFAPSVVNAGFDLKAAVGRVVDRAWYILGSEVANFERRFADFCGSKHCVSVANGTDALTLGLRALRVQPGQEVMMAANAGFYGSTAAHAIGAIPHYIDVDPKTYTLSVPRLEEAIAHRHCAAIIVTHLYGQLADMAEILRVAKTAGVPVLEDCAQAHGAERAGRRAGAFGALGTFSFYPTKNLGAIGDGGAITTSDSQLAERLLALRQYGWQGKYAVAVPGGGNSRLDEVQAAVLNDKLAGLQTMNAQRRRVAARYQQALADLPVTRPASIGNDYVAHLYVLGVDDRAGFCAALAQAGVATAVHYPIADHLQQAYACKQGRGALPVTESLCDKVVSLPCYPGLEATQVDQVIDTIRGHFDRKGAR